VLHFCLILISFQTFTYAQEDTAKDISLPLVRIGVLAFRPKPQTLDQWRTLGDVLNQAIPSHHFVVEALTYPEMNDAVARKQLDFVLTNSGHYVLLKRRSGLSSPLATLAVDESNHKVTSFAGVIFTKADNPDIHTLADIKGKTIAASDGESLGGFQMQAYELFHAGVHLPKDARIAITGMPHDNVIKMVQDNRADVGFVRTGVLEKMEREGKLDLKELRIINAQHEPSFPVVRSTRLYPEWPLATFSHIDEQLSRAVLSTLFRIENNGPLAQLMHIHGFNIPADYTGVLDMLREMRFPPFEDVLLFDIKDVLFHYRWLFVFLSFVIVSALSMTLLYVWRKNAALKRGQALFEELSSQTRTMHWEVTCKGLYTYVSPNIKELLGYEVSEVVNQLYFYDLRPHEDRLGLKERVFKTFQTKESYQNVEGRIVSKTGEVFWILTYGFPVFNSDGTLRGYRGSNTDITKEKLATDALKESEARFKALHNASFGGIVLHDKGRILECNEGLSRMSGYDNATLIGMDGLLLIAPSERDKVMERIRNNEEKPYESIALHQDGTEFPIRLEARMVPYKGHMVRATEFRDIREEKRAQEKLALAASVFTSAREGIIITDNTGVIIDVNDSFTRISGYSKEEAIGQTPHLLYSGHHDAAFYASMWEALTCKDHWYGEIWNRRKNGEIYPEMLTITALRSKEGEAKHYVALFSDITAIKEHQRQLEHIANHDALTGLPNRLLLADRLYQGMVQAKRRGEKLVLAYLDLDGFKAINDTYGHEVGDQLLISLAKQMKQALREGDTLARLGGDEFVAVLNDIKSIESSLRMLTRLLEATFKPVAIGNFILNVSASLGVTFYPQSQDVEADQLLRQADQAMYQAKLSGKNRYHIFDPSHDEDMRSHHESVEHIRLALYREEFVLYYQPKVNMRTGVLIGVEALIRWMHPELGLLSPAAFLPTIEDHPLIVEIGEWVLKTALNQIEAWKTEGHTIGISVNISARQLQDGDFISRLGALLELHPDLEPSLLELEILETSALEDLEHVSSLIVECRNMGVYFALDDFGTGYSSLTYLKQLPVKMLKIDQSFVRDMLDDVNDLAILEGVIGLANAFHKEVIAEGVESIEHGSELLRLGCELAQGYGIARPMPSELVLEWLKSWKPDALWAEDPKSH
jgi:diguanylate cyclase (GGDEF)-like protein/PAS domain S-box-containing protein